jgi:RNA polymerase sigma-70 factor (ECF subfamily)
MANSVYREIETLLPNLKSFALRLTKDPNDADDLLQASAELALSKIHQYTPGTNLRAWLFTIMRNCHINEVRRRARRGVPADANECEELFPQAARQVDQMEVRDVVRACQTLSHDHREVIGLAGIEGRSYAEMSEILDVPVGTVRSRLSRARNNLADWMHSDMH